MRSGRILPILTWVPGYDRADLRGDLAAGLTVGAMLVPQAMAYALLAGLPPEVGLYAATVPVLAYALFGSSRQLAVGPVAVASLLTASALAPVAGQQGSAGYVGAAALLALLVGGAHLVLAAGRLGFLVNLLSHPVLVGFTAAAAVIIGVSQVRHLLGIPVERTEDAWAAAGQVVQNLGEANLPTVLIGSAAVVGLLALKRVARVPAALVVVAGSILAVELLDLEERGVHTVGDIPGSLPSFGLPGLDGPLIGDLATSALVITLIGFTESIAVARVYARRHRYELDANRELVGLGAANVAAGLFGGYPVTGGFARTAVNDGAGARTPLASIVAAGIVLATIAVFTPLLSSLPNAALAAVIVVAVMGLVDVPEMRHIVRVKRADGVNLGVSFAATLLLGFELGLAVAVLSSLLIVFGRLSMPHSAVLGHVEGTTSYRNVERFAEATTIDGIRIVRLDAPLSFVNAAFVKRLLLDHADAVAGGPRPRALVIDASGINDIDASGAQALDEILDELGQRGVTLHLSDVKGPVRDVLRRAGLWDSLGDRLHPCSHDAVAAIAGRRPAPADQRRLGIDERSAAAALPSPQTRPGPHLATREEIP